MNCFKFPEMEISDEELADASADSDTAIYVISRNAGEGTDRTLKGTKGTYNGESYDIGDYYLTDLERENLERVAASFKKTIVVLNVGGIMDTKFYNEINGLDAMLLMGQAGQEGGNALLDVLTGAVTPSGKLADTWAENYSDYPASDTFANADGNVKKEVYNEGIYVGYRYFDSFGVAPRFPFGFGLSYTTFAQTVTEVTLDGKTLAARVQVTNTGKVPGREVVQGYLHIPGSVAQSLTAFAKTPVLTAGESCETTLTIDLADNAVYHEENARWELPQGEYRLYIGKNSRDTVTAAALTLSETVTVRQCRTCCKTPEALQEIEAPAQALPPLPENAVQLTIDPAAFACEAVDYTEPQAAESPRVREVLDSLTTEQQVELLRGGDLQNQTPGQHQITGAGGKTAITLQEQGVPNIVFSDGPAGVNIVEEIIITADGGIKPAKIYGVATFYTQFRLSPIGKHLGADEAACQADVRRRGPARLPLRHRLARRNAAGAELGYRPAGGSRHSCGRRTGRVRYHTAAGSSYEHPPQPAVRTQLRVLF